MERTHTELTARLAKPSGIFRQMDKRHNDSRTRSCPIPVTQGAGKRSSSTRSLSSFGFSEETIDGEELATVEEGNREIPLPLPTLCTVSSWSETSFSSDTEGDCSSTDMALSSSCSSVAVPAGTVVGEGMMEFDESMDCENMDCDVLLRPIANSASAQAGNVTATTDIFSGTATVVSSVCSSPCHCCCATDEEELDFQSFFFDGVRCGDGRVGPSHRSVSPAFVPNGPFDLRQDCNGTPPSICKDTKLVENAGSCLFVEKRNPLAPLPDEMLCLIMSFLDISSLANSRATSRRMQDIASRDAAGWTEHCSRLWINKVQVCAEALTLFKNKHAMKAYKLSILDGAKRNEIKEEELCFDPNDQSFQGAVWSFRFKESAGPDWTSWDPWWNGMEARKMVFLKDGSVMQVVGIDGESGARESISQQADVYTSGEETYERQNWTNEKKDNYILRSAFSDTASSAPHHNHNRSMLNRIAARDNQQVPELMLSTIEVKWRFISQPMDLPSRPRGAYIRLSIGGRDVPTYIVRRSPTGNWGFVLESCWGVYASFDLPPRHNSEDAMNASRAPVTSGTQRRRTRMRLRRTRHGGRWLNVDGIESESEEEDGTVATGFIRENAASHMDDAAMAVTNGMQWREALLYNYGAVSLPEGEGSTEEFDRVWGEVLQVGERGLGGRR